MSSDLIRCCICFSDYDLEKHIPVMLSQCGHNTCEPCVNSIIKSAHPECPICRKVFPNHKLSTKYVPNRQIKERLEKEEHCQSCKIHEGRLLEFYCKTDKCKVCVDCCFDKGEQSHKGHEIERIADLKEEIDNKRKVFEEHLESCRMTHEEVKTIIHKKKQELINKNKELERITKLIAMEASLRVRGVFDEEEEKMEKICGQDSEIAKKIQDRVTEYKNIKTADLSVLLEENPEEFTKKLDNSKVQEYLQNLNNQIKLPEAPVITSDNGKITIDAPTSLTHLKVNGYLKFELRDDELSIISNSLSREKNTIDLIKYDKEVKKVRFSFFKGFDFNDEDMQVLLYLWTRLQPQIESISINYEHIKTCESTTIQDHFIDFPRAIFSHPPNLKSIGFNFFRSNGGERYVKYLTEKILPQCSNLTSLDLSFAHTDLGPQTLPQFITYLNSRPKGITHFSLKLLDQINANLIPLKLPHLKSFKFSTTLSEVTNSIQNGFLHDSLLSMKALDECDLDLINTGNVPHNCVALLSLFYSFSQLKTLKVSMPQTLMAKSELDNLKAQLQGHLKDLQTLIVKVTECTSLFGNQAQLAGTSSLFAQQSSAASSVGLFGNQARSSASSSVFGQPHNIFGNPGRISSSNNQPQQSNILANVPQPTRSLFGNTNNRQGGTEMATGCFRCGQRGHYARDCPLS